MVRKILLTSILSLYAVEAKQLDTNASKHNMQQQEKVSQYRLNSNMVYARSNKEAYQIGEEIGIELKLHKDAFIYFWTIDSNKMPQLILPNNFEAYNAYKKNVAYTVPEVSADYSFVSYKEGVQNIYVLSSLKKLSKKKLHSIIKKSVNKEENKKDNDALIREKQGIVVIAKTPSHDVVHFKVRVISKKKKDDLAVKIAINPYGSAEGHYPEDKR